MDEKNSADNARETTRPELVQRGPVFLSDLFGVHLRSLRLTPPATSFVLNPFTTKLKNDVRICPGGYFWPELVSPALKTPYFDQVKCPLQA